VQRFRDMVSRIKIPVTIEVEDRNVARGYREGAGSNLQFWATDITMDSAIPAHRMDISNRNYEVQMQENIRPVRMVDGYLDYTDGTLSQTSYGSIDYMEILKDMALNRIQRATYENGDSMIISVPLDIFTAAALGTGSFPSQIGHWVDTITGDATHSGYSLPRPLMVTEMTYTRDMVTLRFN